MNAPKKDPIPCVCMTCGIRDDDSHPGGLCQNGHDNWFEYRDLHMDSQWFKFMIKATGWKRTKFIQQFKDPTVKLFPVADTRYATEDPECCTKCSTRTEFNEYPDLHAQYHKCPKCSYEYWVLDELADDIRITVKK